MAARERRRTTAAAARLIALVAANLACFGILWKLCVAGPSGARAAAPAHERVETPAPPPVAQASTASSAQSASLAAPPPNAQPGRPAALRSVERDAWLEARIRKRVGDALKHALEESKGRLHPGDVTIAIHVRERGANGDLVALDAEREMRPASNMKLVTSAAALVLLGPTYCFETVFESTGALRDGKLAGDLVVRAGGDPLFELESDGNCDAFFERVVGELRRAGVSAIEGALVLDEGDFQDPAPAPAWPAENQRWNEFCALSGGFSLNAGCLTALVRATRPGTAADVEVLPRHHGLSAKFDVQTKGAREPLDIRVAALNGNVRVEGSLPKDVPRWSTRFAAPDPVLLFGSALSGALAEHGIRVRDGLRRERRDPRETRTRLACLRTPLAQTLMPINTHSNNACADQLFLMMGHAVEGHGTRAGGRAATARALTRLGVATERLVQVDGSGLSRDNRVSARQITALVDAVLRLDTHTAGAYLDSLAVGAESGTLDGRMRDPELRGRVHAKTGFIAGTSALSGLVDARDGRSLVFSILVEYPPIEGLNKSCWKPMEDRICEELVGSDG